MPSCPNCSAKVTEAMSFCPNCGMNLKPTAKPVEVAAPAPTTAPPPPIARYEKQEKGEKQEKHEKGETTEKYEKRQYGSFGPIVVGVILLGLGLFFYLTNAGLLNLPTQFAWAYFLIIVGIAIILLVIVGVVRASQRHPPT